MPDVLHDQWKREPRALGVQSAQTTTRSKIHYQKWGSSLYPKLEDAYNMRVFQVSNTPGFQAELFDAIIDQLSMEYFDRCLGIQVDVFTQVNFSRTTCT